MDHKENFNTFSDYSDDKVRQESDCDVVWEGNPDGKSGGERRSLGFTSVYPLRAGKFVDVTSRRTVNAKLTKPNRILCRVCFLPRNTCQRSLPT